MARTEMGTGSFPTMGTSAAQLACVAKPIKGRSVPRNNSKGGSPYPEGRKANRGNVLERQGATMHPVMSHVKQNDPNASATGRNLRIMPSVASKSGSFDGERARVASAS